MAFVTATPILSARATPASTTLRINRAVRVTSFRGARLVNTPAPTNSCIRMGFEISDGVEWDSNPIVFILAIVGWVLPSSLPAGIPLTGGTGLTQAFFASVNANLANFPKGPAGDDPFWTLCFLWHVGMFATMIFGSIGYNLRNAKE